jgi:hypothetical protein
LVPGAPPTPNAVNVDIDADGEFSVLNRFGFAQLIIDVVGVYRAHDHDDRYYRKTEVDAAIEQSSTMWARVNPDGTRRASSTRVTTEKYLGWAGGVYTITFPQTVTNCAFSVTRSDDYTDRVSAQAVAGADLSSPLEPTQVFVSFISDDSGSAANQYAFSITANC